MKTTVITGLGVTAPNGMGVETYWKALLDGRSGIGPLTGFDTSRFPSCLAGRIDDFVPADHIPGRLIPATDRSTQLALVAADWALSDAGLPSEIVDDYDIGVVTSNALGGFAFTHKEFQALWNQGPKFVSVYESYAWFYAVNTGQISIRHTLRGPSAALVAEQAGGLDALGHARRTVRRGTPAVVCGGVDSAFDPWGYASQLAGGLVSTETDPGRAYQPFGSRARGYVPGEGGALLVLEDEATARARGVRDPYGVLAGCASTFDPAPGSDRPPALGRAITAALSDAGLTPADIDVVFADGAGVAELDAAEAAALREVFGPSGVPVTAPKAFTGRLYSGGGPLDVVTALLSIRDGVIPPTPTPDGVPSEYGVDLVAGRPRECAVRTALVLARGRRGFNSAVVVRTADR
ncbi:ketosynthase chain-length factor [Streptomyces heilongjiangensis]|uniref:Ketosynthase chain-length factor n=1 Tax=Streptomyces heilongjiangensis TaxID=945052 RepID=A0ABW1BBF4_9ACTN|nr:ketosynthase chain-length factor [Streptomyces heilongjiangensis]MDC2948765.1 ketosynthase chain-length factor [Streptomyces heilongjiangensis]